MTSTPERPSENDIRQKVAGAVLIVGLTIVLMALPFIIF